MNQLNENEIKSNSNYKSIKKENNVIENIENKYVEKLIEEIEKEEVSNKEEREVTSIYFGGGTPSFIDENLIEKIMKKIKEKFKISKNPEITIEVNPGTVDEKKLKKYYEIGFNRISIGLQTTNDKLLKEIGRIHTYSEFIQTINLAKKVGFKNINVDLMIGLPNQTLNDIKDSLNKIINLNVNHISVYSLIVEEGTQMENLINNGKLKLPSENLERKEYWYVKNTLEKNRI